MVSVHVSDGFPKKCGWGLVGWSVGEVRSIELFFIIRRCDIGVVSHLLGQFAKTRSRCIFIDGSITPCLLVWDPHTPSSVATSSFFQFVLTRLFAVLLLSTFIFYFGGKDCHHFQKSTQRTLREGDNGHPLQM